MCCLVGTFFWLKVTLLVMFDLIINWEHYIKFQSSFYHEDHLSLFNRVKLYVPVLVCKDYMEIIGR